MWHVTANIVNVNHILAAALLISEIIYEMSQTESI